ncbi:MAG: IS4 family transposase [Verrucomicrobiales bacterium]
MQNKTPTRANVVVLKQMLKLIPLGMINRIARETGAEDKSRTFTPVSHLTAMLFAQLSRAIGLNDVCDWLRLKAPVLARFGVSPPSRNGLSTANRERDALFAEKLFWDLLGHLQHGCPSFAAGKKGKGLLRRFKVRIHAVDSTVMQLVANCLDWAKHRRRKAAAKMHLRLDLHSFLPSFAIVDTAGEHDNKRAREVCAGILSGEIVIFDKAYVDFLHLSELDERGVFWVTRAKDNMKYRALKNLSKPHGNIIRDQRISLQGKHKGMVVRRVEARVEVDGEWRIMVFITNNFDWSPQSVCDLYRRRWDIKVFFKQVKQSLKLGSFLGHNANAVKWQVYTALMVYVPLRYMAHLSEWGHSFTRLFAVVRSTVWERIDLLALLKSYGTASGRFRVLGALDQAWLPGFAPSAR